MTHVATFFPALHRTVPALRHLLPLVAVVWNPASRQHLLDDFFEARSAHWRDVYYSEGLSGFLYRVRKEIVLNLMIQLDLPSGARVLDAGCGAGFMAVALAQRGYEVQAVDVAPAMISQTRKLAEVADVDQRIRVGFGDIQNLTFSDGTFDAALAIGVLPWVGDPFQALRELARVIRPGGHVILAVDNSWTLSNILDPLCFPGLRGMRQMVRRRVDTWGIFGKNLHGPRLRYFAIREFDSMLAGAGLNKVHGSTFGFGPFTFLKMRLFSDSVGIKLHRKLQRLADRGSSFLRSTGLGYVVLARKEA